MSTSRSGSCCCAIHVNVGEAASTAEMEGRTCASLLLITITVCFIGGRGLTFQASQRKGFCHLDLLFHTSPVPLGFWTIPYSSLVLDSLPNLCFAGFFPRTLLALHDTRSQPTMASSKQTRNTRFSFCALFTLILLETETVLCS